MNNTSTSSSKRIWAAVIDLVIFYILMILLTSFAIQPIINVTTDYQEKYQVYETILVEKNIVTKTDDGLVLVINKFDINKSSEYDQILIDLYSDESYKTEDNKELDEYISRKIKATDVFEYNEESKTFTLIGDKDETYEFYVTEYNSALNYLYTYDEVYKDAYSSCSFYLNLSKIIGILLSGTIVYLVMPLILKKGKTIGKLIFKLSLSKDGEKYEQIHFGQLLTRYLTIVIIEILGSQVFYYVPMIISLMTMMFTQKRFAIHDYLAKTYVIEDMKKEVINTTFEEKIKEDLETEKIIDVECIDNNDKLDIVEENNTDIEK